MTLEAPKNSQLHKLHEIAITSKWPHSKQEAIHLISMSSSSLQLHFNSTCSSLSLSLNLDPLLWNAPILISKSTTSNAPTSRSTNVNPPPSCAKSRSTASLLNNRRFYSSFLCCFLLTLKIPCFSLLPMQGSLPQQKFSFFLLSHTLSFSFWTLSHLNNKKTNQKNLQAVLLITAPLLIEPLQLHNTFDPARRLDPVTTARRIVDQNF